MNLDFEKSLEYICESKYAYIFLGFLFILLMYFSYSLYTELKTIKNWDYNQIVQFKLDK